MEKIFKDIKNIILKYDNIVLTGHKDPDLDSLGSCLGLFEIVSNMDKNAYLFLNNSLNEYNSNIVNSLDLLSKHKKKISILNEDKLNKLDGKTLVIILDVNIKERLEYPKLIEEYDYIVLDHHIKNKNYLKNSLYMYDNSNLSSVCELITYFTSYNNVNLNDIISTILLSGIEIDTNGFNLKTTSNTYRAAAILMDMGADTILKQELLKESKDEYIKRANSIRNSFMVTENIAMCIITAQTTQMDLAVISEELLTFEHVEASFTIGKIDKNTVGVSARSLGNIDVLSIIKKLGGGGHKSNAATQIKDITINALKKELTDLLK